MRYFPIFLNIQGIPVLVVGGGKVALRKIRSLNESEAKVTVIAPAILSEIEELPSVTCLKRPASIEDVTGGFRLIILATNQPKLQEELSAGCKANGISYNRCDDPDDSDFVTGSVAYVSPILAAFTSSGSPTLSRLVKKRFENALEPALIDLGNLLLEIRPLVKNKFPNYIDREKFFVKLVTESTVDRIRREGIDCLRQEIFKCLLS
ncbi:bifunctional precorrin-2 dehydrogenase/sirohydrochlorin ferrochelatase [bacterium]|nr:bifunctional precorrin-2 dehydrogenase/sirohydrochlorin ferrochelatase [bacterium]